MDAAGNLYGTASAGGSANAGLVFKLVAPTTAGAPWTERILYVFGTFAGDGRMPESGLLLRGRILYGTTVDGGTAGQGTVFRLVGKSGLWTETILHSFTGSDGSVPMGGLIADSAGNLYGTAYAGGNTACTGGGGRKGCGTIYELSPPAVAGDPWQETTLFRFIKGSTGTTPQGKLWRDKSNDLYGTTRLGGLNTHNLGSVFKLKPPPVAGGAWTLVALHSFRGDSVEDGNDPNSALILLNGAFYGTTLNGGINEAGLDNGTVFSISFAP